MFKVDVDFSSINNAFKESELDILWSKVGAFIYAEVKKGMIKGVNTNNKKMIDYTASYKKYKTKAGNYRGRVDLVFEGTLFKRIAFEGNKKGFSIFINGDKENKIAIRWNSSKNWSFFEWGTQLYKQLDKAINKELKL